MAVIKIITPSVTDNTITLAKMASGTDGNIISYDTSGNPVAVATGSSGQVLTSAGAGAIPSFQTAGGGTNTPAFEAFVSARTNISDNTDTKVAFNTEVFDVGSQYDNSSNFRFTPTTSGKYFVYANIGMGSGDNSGFGQGSIIIKKNGSNYVKGRMDNSSNNPNSMYKNISSVVAMNGSGDYLEIFINVNSTATPYVEGNNNHVKASLFGAFKIIE